MLDRLARVAHERPRALVGDLRELRHEADARQHVVLEAQPVEADVHVRAEEHVEEHVVVERGDVLALERLEQLDLQHGDAHHARVEVLVRVHQPRQVQQVHAVVLQRLRVRRGRVAAAEERQRVLELLVRREAVPLLHHEVELVRVRD